MATTRALYQQAVTYRKSVAFTRREDVWTCKRLTAEVEPLKQDAQVLRKDSRVQPEIVVSAVDAQKITLERVTRCAA
jgi:hypothetical protein